MDTDAAFSTSWVIVLLCANEKQTCKALFFIITFSLKQSQSPMRAAQSVLLQLLVEDRKTCQRCRVHGKLLHIGGFRYY